MSDFGKCERGCFMPAWFLMLIAVEFFFAGVAFLVQGRVPIAGYCLSAAVLNGFVIWMGK